MSYTDQRQYAPATQRNRQVILEVLQQYLPASGTVLEIASGTGEHAAFFAPLLRPRRWLPTDVNPLALDSIAAWQAHLQTDHPDETLTNFLYPPIALDVAAAVWPVEATPLPDSLVDAGFEPGEIGAIAAINLIHISPWSACEGLIAGAGRILSPGGVLYLYGPYKKAGTHTAPSNKAFDQSLRCRNPAWGVRDLEAVVELAAAQGLSPHAVIAMPANNFSVVLVKT